MRGYTNTFLALKFPNAEPTNVEVQLLTTDGTATAPLTQQQKDGLLAGNIYYVIYARVTYFDAFGEHWTHFCGWKSVSLTAQKTFSSGGCVDYNAVGDGPDRTRPIVTDRMAFPQ